ncbi:MAG: hypothetical protein OXH34_02935, partial [Bacteroidetes bacterium]|nr:hypothetical protein [Bacteroidota bacterium]
MPSMAKPGCRSPTAWRWPHASFNMGETPAILFVALTPAELEQPLSEDLSDQEPWSMLRARNS